MKELDYDLFNVSSASEDNDEIVFIPEAKQDSEQKQAIDFSNKVVEILQSKLKEFNSKHEKRIRISQAKEIYCLGARLRPSDSEFTMNEWALARVNLFFQISSGNIEEVNLDISKKTSYNKLMDITNIIVPSNEDLHKAKLEAQDYDMDYPYDNIEDLYIEETDPYYIDY